ncbi:CPBP family intramembrane metalloprotease [Pseudoclavibacter chungangensis]|uniref:CPBP family intramembrane metalloprotease n=2 Tax=Pseudoclavibacter chungangensis TaxID=587635 RepID=A0A7J5BT44_9MICO|nr:CPBP family intramembrane glutamic endopeptidase [Pseudoclavibacter chungangensis]KAB1656362.1 CPBP family intramembrane metalloprotease [Pseudoclavibacter chungangensis]
MRRRLERGADALPTKVPWGAVTVFIAIAFVGAWLACLPLWLGGASLDVVDPVTFQLLLLGMMYTPTIAALVVVFLVQRPARKARYLGLVFRPSGRTILFIAIGIVAPPVLFALSMLLAAALGYVTLDLANVSALRELFAQNLAAAGASDQAGTFDAMPPAVLVLITILQTLVFAVPMATIAAFGEELGWRGWLLPSLRPLGTWPAIAISCVVWALWHAPIILLGYNFNDRGPLGLVMMIGFCLAGGSFISWLRLRSATVYPAAVAHGSLNAFAATIFICMADAGSTMDGLTTIVGWTGWVPFLLLVGVLVLLGQFARQPLPGLTLAESVIASQRAGEATPATSGAVSH